jgi:hypothetical protein
LREGGRACTLPQEVRVPCDPRSSAPVGRSPETPWPVTAASWCMWGRCCRGEPSGAVGGRCGGPPGLRAQGGRVDGWRVGRPRGGLDVGPRAFQRAVGRRSRGWERFPPRTPEVDINPLT